MKKVLITVFLICILTSTGFCFQTNGIHISGFAVTEFGEIGKIDGFSENGIVINDSLYQFAIDATLLSKNGGTLLLSSFNVGDRVGYEVDPEGRISRLQKLD